jgi:hypothetical protein
MTQKLKVKNRIEEIGYVDNFWAIESYILRLGAIIYELRKEGYDFMGAFGKEMGKDKPLWKNYYYTAIKKPEREVYKVVGNRDKQEILL